MKIQKGFRAVITGAGSGLGRALAVEVAKRGGSVLAADLNIESAKETVRFIEDAGGVASAVHCDVAKYEMVENLLSVAEERMGGAELIANNAGVACGGAVHTLSLDDWHWTMNINLWGVIHGCHAFLPYFWKRGEGHVLNVASAAGLLSPPLLGPYNTTKAAVVALTETIHAETQGKKLGATVLCPTFFKTNINSSGRTTDPRVHEATSKAMERSKVSAEDVAIAALEACERNQLYCLPMDDAQEEWTLKRSLPEQYREISALRTELAKRSTGE